MKKILVIDNDQDIINVLQQLLKRQGYTVATASQEADAYQKIGQFEPDLVLLDVLLSGVDGREICRQIKNSDPVEPVPVIIISAHPGVQKHLEECKADDFILKPFDVHNLLQKIEQHLEKVNKQGSSDH